MATQITLEEPRSDHTAPGQRPRSHRRLAAFAAALVLTMALFATAAASPSGAVLAGYGGQPGTYRASYPITCRHKIFGQSQTLQMWVPAPAVYARNYKAGAGNDAAYVRYAVLVWDARTGGLVTSTSFSSFLRATDVRAAVWNGGTPFTLNALDGRTYSVEYRIEWWTSTRRLGWVSERSITYNYYSYSNVGPIRLQACFRYRDY